MSALSSDRMKALASGLAGGVAGLLAMQLVSKLVSPLVRARARKPTDVFMTERSISPLGPRHHPDEAATDAMARIGYEKLVGREPSPRAKVALSWGLHIAYGLGAAAIYGVVRAHSRHIVRDGFIFGASLWILGYELAMPLLGLRDKPTAYSPSRHLQTLAAHVGYGVAASATAHYLEDQLS